MRIAFTHNLQRSDAVEEAEFDTPETVAAITEGLASLGHEVHPVEVSQPLPTLVARLQMLRPELVFNTAEGRHGRLREAFYPALFEQLGLITTGSSAYTCALTLDKRLSKLLVAQAGVPAPRGVLVERADVPLPERLRFPLMLKPNFEGSSMGITQDSVVADANAYRHRVAALLESFPGGLLVEEYIAGHDVVVPFLELASPQTGGVLAAADYRFDPQAVAGRAWDIYDFELKHARSDAVTVRVPATLNVTQERELQRLSRLVYRALAVRDMGRIDFRIAADDGRVLFIECNALPSLEPGAAIYASARLAGLDTEPEVLDIILRSAAQRHGLDLHRPRRRPAARDTGTPETRPLRVGLIYNLKRTDPQVDDSQAEFDAPSTIEAIRQVLAESLGYEVVPLEAVPGMLEALPGAGLDLAFNIAEGIRGRGREAVVPGMLEMLGIEYTGSDLTTLAITLDKALAKQVVEREGVPTARHVVTTSPADPLPEAMVFPLVVKPNAEGSSKGIGATSVVRSRQELEGEVGRVVERYGGGALVETYLPGREFTVGLLGPAEAPRALPIMEMVFLEGGARLPVYSFEHKQETDRSIRFDCPAQVDEALAQEIQRVALGAWRALGCRDVARIDLRCDETGRVHFIECNPLPGLTPGFSDLCVIAQAAGMDYAELIGAILAPALGRLQERPEEASAGER